MKTWWWLQRNEMLLLERRRRHRAPSLAPSVALRLPGARSSPQPQGMTYQARETTALETVHPRPLLPVVLPVVALAP